MGADAENVPVTGFVSLVPSNVHVEDPLIEPPPDKEVCVSVIPLEPPPLPEQEKPSPDTFPKPETDMVVLVVVNVAVTIPQLKDSLPPLRGSVNVGLHAPLPRPESHETLALHVSVFEKFAITPLSASMVSTQEPVPVHAPDQPVK